MEQQLDTNPRLRQWVQTPAPKSAAWPDIYLERKIMTASPEELIKYIYDAGIIACKRNQKAKALEALQELINALRFDHDEIAMSFYQTYRGIMDLIGGNQWDRAIALLTEIRLSWVTALNLK